MQIIHEKYDDDEDVDDEKDGAGDDHEKDDDNVDYDDESLLPGARHCEGADEVKYEKYDANYS